MRRIVLFFGLLCSAWNGVCAADDLMRKEWQIDGVTREALVYAPAAATTTPSPLVFAFHGHGGTMQNAAKSFGYHKLWPEAIVVYMQGLNTPGRLTDPEGKKPGWQKSVGDQHDRDLKFFDAVLATLRKDYRVDDKRVYSTGHSNGGGFTYLLWAARGDVFAAVAPCAAAAPHAAAAEYLDKIKPKPVLHLAGENDPLVLFEWQKQTIEILRKLNGCDGEQPWGPHCTLYPSKTGTPVVAYIHSGRHELPAEALPVIVKFFKEHSK
jgi:polyhydroxybutyrate depolymerase